MRRSIVLLAILATGTAAEAGPELGPRTRLTFRDNHRVTGQLIFYSADSLYVLDDRGSSSKISTGDITSLEYQVGTRDYVRRGAIAGAIVGIVGGAILGYQIEVPMFHPPEEHDADDSGNTGWSVALAMVGGLVGTAVGAGFGGLFETEEWALQPIVSLTDSHDFSVGLVIGPPQRSP